MVARSMPLYDLMLLLDPAAPDDRREAILRDTQKLIESDGKIVGVHDWGTRRMAFEINHQPEAAYHLIQFETEKSSGLLERLDHSLKIMDGVLRHRIIKLKDGTPPPPMPRPEGRREAPEGQPAAEAPATTNGQTAEAAQPAAAEAAPAAAEAAPAEADAAPAEAVPAEATPADATPAGAAPAEAPPAEATPAEAAPAEAAPAEAEAPVAVDAPAAPADEAAAPAGEGDDGAPSAPSAA
jgi:small subunit ribosomal protein S6